MPLARAACTPPPRPDEARKALLKKMQAIVADIAEALGLATEIVAPKKELSLALTGNRNLRVFRGWRRDLVGSELLELLGDQAPAASSHNTANNRS